MASPFLTARWENLLMANFHIDPAILQPFLPCYTELDPFNGLHYVSLVGFLFADTKLKGIPVPFHRNFPEVNLRFYVRYRDGNSWKRGVVFIKEIVPRSMITLIANTLYGENYATHQMQWQWKKESGIMKAEYRWKMKDGWNYIRAVADPEPMLPEEDSKENFITEHYWGYTKINSDCTGLYEVQHPRWRVHKVNEFSMHCDAGKLYGSAFAAPLAEKPASVFLAEGSPVVIMKGERVKR